MALKKSVFAFVMTFLCIIYATCFGVATFFGTAFSWTSQMILTVSLVPFLMILTYFVGGQSAHSRAHVLFKGLGGVSMGILSIAMSVSILGALALFIGAPAQLTGQIASGLLLAGVAIGLCVNYRAPRLITHQITIGSGGKTCRIVHLTDLHINGLKHASWTKALVTQINAWAPDIIVFTGDLADVQYDQAKGSLQLLRNLNATQGKFAISGNHDFYNGYAGFQAMLDTMGFTLVDNRCVALDGLYIAGISDQDGQRFGYPRPVITQVLAQRTESWPTILLDHRPDHFKKNIKEGVDLQLSGHTHGGQMPPWNIVVKLWYTFSAGLYSFENSQIYISKGTGTWGPPIRLFARSEVTFFEVRF